MPSYTLAGAISCFLLFIFFILAACPSEVSAWNDDYHPDHKGKKHPLMDLPDWPPYLPNWLANNRTHTCYPTYDYIRDAHKLNVLYVADSFCRYVAGLSRNQNATRPMEMIEQRYNTNLYYQKKENSIYDNMYIVRVQDMGESCEIRSSVDLDDDGFATDSEPFSTSPRDYINVEQPIGVRIYPSLGLGLIADTRSLQVQAEGWDRIGNLCRQIIYNTWAQCFANEGRGGELAVEAGCVKYSIEPINAQNHITPKCPEHCITPLYLNKTEKAAGRPIPEITPKNWLLGSPSHP